MRARHTSALLPILLTMTVAAAQTSTSSPWTNFWNGLLLRSAQNHSPTPEEIAAAGSPTTQPDAAAVAESRPSIRKALLSPDSAVRACALTALTGLELQPPAPAASASVAPSPTSVKTDTPPAPPGPGSYKVEIAAILVEAVPEIAQNLTDESPGNRILAATVLGGFAPSGPQAVYPPLLSYLKREDGIGPTGLAVVDDLLAFVPISARTADAVTAYLRRSDQTADSRSGLIDSIANRANQSQAIDKALLAYLDTDEPAVRAHLILSLPQLDLAPEVFADTRARIAILASDNQEDPHVLNAAKSVALCWTAPHMPTGCPAY